MIRENSLVVLVPAVGISAVFAVDSGTHRDVQAPPSNTQTAAGAAYAKEIGKIPSAWDFEHR